MLLAQQAHITKNQCKFYLLYYATFPQNLNQSGLFEIIIIIFYTLGCKDP